MPVLALLLLITAILQAEEWSRFRGPNGSGITTDKGFPTEFGPKKNLVWSTPVRPGGKSSPVLTKTSVFLTSFEDGKLYTQCFDRTTGKLLWERSEPKPREDGVHQLNHPAGSTPATDGDNVYVFFKDFGLLSYSSSGKLRWRVPLGPFNNSMGLGASPILAGDLVILQADQLDNSYIAAYSKSNGELRWKIAREESQSWGTPLLYQPPGKQPQIITAAAGQVGGHLISNGKRTFTFPGASPVVVGSPVLDRDTIYAFGYGFSTAVPIPFSRSLASKDRNKDGKLTPDEYGTESVMNAIGKYIGDRNGEVTEEKWGLWLKVVGGSTGLVALNLEREGEGVQPRQLWRFDKGFESVIPTALAYEGLIYSVKNGGILTAIDAKTGQLAKMGRVTGALGGYSASPVLAEGLLYIASEEGKITIIRPGREWEVLQINDIGAGFFATPALSGGRIFAHGTRELYCFGAK
jgi:outer membrane protein assembly factor BamB